MPIKEPRMSSNRRTISSTGPSTRRKTSIRFSNASSKTMRLTFAKRSRILGGCFSSQTLKPGSTISGWRASLRLALYLRTMLMRERKRVCTNFSSAVPPSGGSSSFSAHDR